MITLYTMVDHRNAIQDKELIKIRESARDRQAFWPSRLGRAGRAKWLRRTGRRADRGGRAVALVLAPYSVQGTTTYRDGLRAIQAAFPQMDALPLPHQIDLDEQLSFTLDVLEQGRATHAFIIADDDWTVGSGIDRMRRRCDAARLSVYGVWPDGTVGAGVALILTAPSNKQARYMLVPDALDPTMRDMLPPLRPPGTPGTPGTPARATRPPQPRQGVRR